MIETKTPSRRGQEAWSLLTFSSWLLVSPVTNNTNKPATNPALEIVVLILATTSTYLVCCVFIDLAGCA